MKHHRCLQELPAHHVSSCKQRHTTRTTDASEPAPQAPAGTCLRGIGIVRSYANNGILPEPRSPIKHHGCRPELPHITCPRANNGTLREQRMRPTGTPGTSENVSPLLTTDPQHGRYRHAENPTPSEPDPHPSPISLSLPSTRHAHRPLLNKGALPPRI